jgi:hypothetical protein
VWPLMMDPVEDLHDGFESIELREPMLPVDARDVRWAFLKIIASESKFLGTLVLS